MCVSRVTGSGAACVRGLSGQVISGIRTLGIEMERTCEVEVETRSTPSSVSGDEREQQSADTLATRDAFKKAEDDESDCVVCPVDCVEVRDLMLGLTAAAAAATNCRNLFVRARVFCFVLLRPDPHTRSYAASYCGRIFSLLLFSLAFFFHLRLGRFVPTAF